MFYQSNGSVCELFIPIIIRKCLRKSSRHQPSHTTIAVWCNYQACHVSGFFLISGFFYKSPFGLKCSWKKRSSHQWKKRIACIVSILQDLFDLSSHTLNYFQAASETMYYLTFLPDLTYGVPHVSMHSPILLLARYGGVYHGQRAELLLHGDEHKTSGWTSRHGDGHEHRPGRMATQGTDNSKKRPHTHTHPCLPLTTSHYLPLPPYPFTLPSRML